MPNASQYISEDASNVYIEEIIEKTPNFLIRSGILITTIAFGLIIFLSVFIKYPDKIVSTGILTSDHPPIQIIAKTSGIIDTLFIQNNDIIEENAPILYLKNTANFDHVQTLISFLEHHDFEDSKTLNLNNSLKVGVLQNDYAQLILFLNEFDQEMNNSFVDENVLSINEEIDRIKLLEGSVNVQQQIFDSELSIVEEGMKRSSSLAANGSISRQELEMSQITLLKYQKDREQLNANQIQNEIRIAQLSFEMKRLREEKIERLRTLKFKIKELINVLSGKIEIWKNEHVIFAPVKGYFMISSNIVKNKHIESSEFIGTIVENIDDSNYFVKAKTNATGVGKIKLGDKVIIKLEAYPYKEFGTIISSVQNVSRVPIEVDGVYNFYEVTVPLQNTIRTNYKKTIEFKPNAALVAEIVTEEKSVFERIFNQLFDLVKNN